MKSWKIKFIYLLKCIYCLWNLEIWKMKLILSNYGGIHD